MNSCVNNHETQRSKATIASKEVNSPIKTIYPSKLDFSLFTIGSQPESNSMSFAYHSGLSRSNMTQFQSFVHQQRESKPAARKSIAEIKKSSVGRSFVKVVTNTSFMGNETQSNIAH